MAPSIKMLTLATLRIINWHAVGISILPLADNNVPYDTTVQDLQNQRRTSSGLTFKDLAIAHAEIKPVHKKNGKDYFCPGPPDRDVYDRPPKVQPTVEIKLSGGFGTIKAREYGAKGGKFALLIHQVHSDGGEWEPVALKLAAKGWYVLQPSWTGNKKTDPTQCVEPSGYSRWRCYPQAYSSNLNDILKVSGYDKFDAILGFSWGGWAAGMRAAKFPDSVNRVALVAPAFINEPEAKKLKEMITVPTALFMGADDKWVPYANSDFILPMMTNAKFVPSPGDHCIHPEWESKIVDFVNQKSGVPAIYTPA